MIVSAALTLIIHSQLTHQIPQKTISTEIYLWAQRPNFSLFYSFWTTNQVSQCFAFANSVTKALVGYVEARDGAYHPSGPVRFLPLKFKQFAEATKKFQVNRKVKEFIRNLLTKILAWSLIRKCFLLKLNLRILAQLKVLIFVFPCNKTCGWFQTAWARIGL